ncbi:MAG: hypothetical protein WA880_07355 [Ornithinimicrobium sp.]
MAEADQSNTLVLRNVKDDEGTMWRAVTLSSDGELTVRGHDLGPGVKKHFGHDEYEFDRRFGADEVVGLCAARAGIHGASWSRVGD